MAKVRSKFEFQFNCEDKIINNIIEYYISHYNGKLLNRDGEEYYFLQMPPLVPYFKYSINGNILTIYAWFGGAFREEIPVEKNKSNIYSGLYLDSLSSLFQEIEKHCDTASVNNINKENSNKYQNLKSNKDNNSNNLKNENEKRKKIVCELGFWMSIIIFVFSLFSGFSNYILYVLNFIFIMQGFGTPKEKKAKSAIILIILSIILSIIFKDGIIEAILF